MHNLLEYSDNCYMTSESLWNHYRDEVNDSADEKKDANNHRINNNKTTKKIFSVYKTKLIGNTPNNNSRLNKEVAVPLKYLSKSWRSLDFLLINCEIELDMINIWCNILKYQRFLKYQDCLK